MILPPGRICFQSELSAQNTLEIMQKMLYYGQNGEIKKVGSGRATAYVKN